MLTATKHYFEAEFIERYERDAAADPRTMQRAAALLDALDAAPQMHADGWGKTVAYESAWVGRGIEPGAQDDQIRATLATGILSMPLWGLSLDRDVARSFGTGFQFELVGSFPAIAAWTESEIKSSERELIAGGRYRVENVNETLTGTTVVQLRYLAALPRA
ncbi:hypothetical protein [Microbacterium sp. KHB019]|uniref:hypothetical protein n=1 Tax=Microbacterium sp. KHB019 TaxID=3129770 RepID=UPI00307A7B01